MIKDLRFFLCIKWGSKWNVRSAYTSMDDALYNAESIDVDTYPTCIVELAP